MSTDEPIRPPEEPDADEALYEDDYDDDEYEDEEYLATVSRAAWADPRTRNLVTIVFTTLIVFLVGVATLIAFVLSLRGAPRTEVERRIQLAEQATEAEPRDPLVWARLATAYSDANRYGDALDAVKRGREVSLTPELDFAEGLAHSAAGRHERAVEAFEKAEQSQEKRFAAQVAEREARGVSMLEIDRFRADILRAKGESLAELGRVDEAIQAYQASLEMVPRRADTQAALGELLEQAGRTEEAIEAYRAALTYVPDFAPALDGLNRLGEEQ